MKLTKLRLLGFKSFVEPTDFLIEPGLTGVVGPNGCGKSNLVEALRWVMGESSHKSMRAASMDDVIFSGTNNRPARNMAEVMISIDNSERSAPAQFNDDDNLDITRRIEREEGSSYRINGRDVRARDVQMVFADASTGARSPALVHQGRIGEIIQAKPEQRRRVLEEAAGIAGLHARRHEAELRLKAAETNLTRLEDVIGQLAGQMESLKKQAKQAIRYRTVSAQVRKAEATLFHLRWMAAQQEVIDSEHAKDEAVRVVAERTGAQAEASTRQVEAQASLPALRDAEARAAATLQRLNVARNDLEREEQRAKDRILELETRLVQFTADAEREQRLIADAEAALARLEAEAEMLRVEAQNNATRRSGIDAQVHEAGDALNTVEKVFSDITSELAALTARRNQLEAAARNHADRIARHESELADVARELDEMKAAEAGGPDLMALNAEVEATQQAVAEAEEAAQAAETAHLVARENLDAARQPFAEAERHAQRLETEAKTLAKVLAVETKNMWPPVIDGVSVEKGYEKAIGAALGDELDAPVDTSSPIHWGGAAVDPTDPALPEGVKPLSSFVVAPQELARRLAQIGIVERAQGAQLAKHLKTGQRLVSVEGDLWRWDGFAAAAHAPTGAARRLAERNRLSEIETELDDARLDLDEKRNAVEAARQAVQDAAAAESAARSANRDRQADQTEWTTRKNGASGQIATLETRIAEATAERTTLANAPEAFEEKRVALISEIEIAESERRAEADKLAAAEEALAQADRDARAALEAMGSAREALARAEERFEGARRRLTDVAREIHEVLEVEPDGVAPLAELAEGDVLPDVTEVEATLDRLRRERERLGAVNLRAEEELREVEEQHTKLTTERDDLVEAIKKLRLGIQSLFTQLFGGGSAELQLIESDDPLEAGLEILAKPPGKKPATLSLLSGGEQALTAMALIFAVFLTNPAPICVLDEVDAPLDDHNVERFCDLLTEMTKMTDTRFVIITHNPITMARMNRLFGVTMAERGVSQLVSVDLETAAKFRDVA